MLCTKVYQNPQTVFQVKNVMDLCIGVLLYFAVGYGIMYGDSISGGFMGRGGILGITFEG